ncbi:hypothetical protein WA158_000962 [Blastocystis sp. Blastoise]
MEAVIESTIIEAKKVLKDCSSADTIIQLIRKYPEDVNLFMTLISQINDDMTKRSHNKMDINQPQVPIPEVIQGYCQIPQISLFSPKGKYDIILSSKGIYCKSSTKLIHISWKNVGLIICTPHNENKKLSIVTIYCKEPIHIGKREYGCIGFSLENSKEGTISYSSTQDTNNIEIIKSGMCDVFIQALFKASNINVIYPDSSIYKSTLQKPYFTASYGVTPCTVYPLKTGLLLIASQCIYIPGGNIKNLRTERVGRSTFDYVIDDKLSHVYSVNMVPINEMPSLGAYSGNLLRSFQSNVIDKSSDTKTDGDENSTDEDDSNFTADVDSDIGSLDEMDSDGIVDEDADDIPDEHFTIEPKETVKRRHTLKKKESAIEVLTDDSSNEATSHIKRKKLD